MAADNLLVRSGEPDDAVEIARLHATAVAEGFLPTLGPGFLRILHRRIIVDPSSFSMVAVDDDGLVVGVCAATSDVGALYRTFLLRDGFRAGLVAFGRLVRTLPLALETLRHPNRDGDLPAAEILVVAVHPDAQSRGIGRALVEATIAEFEARGVDAVRVVTTASNTAALALYDRTGFTPEATIEVHKGTESVMLVRAHGGGDLS